LIARITGDRIRHRPSRLATLPGARIGQRQRRQAGLAVARVGKLRRQQHIGIKPQIGKRRIGERLHELSRLTNEALKKGPDPSTSPNDIAYFGSRYNVRCSSCLRLSRIDSTPLSLSRAGLSCVRLSFTTADICRAAAPRLIINASTELRCVRSSASNALALTTRLAI
jgi:hypothetical protein